MRHKPLLTEGQQQELDMIRKMSYEEANKLASNQPICESSGVVDYAQHIDMTLDEFIRTYNLEDITGELMRYKQVAIHD